MNYSYGNMHASFYSPPGSVYQGGGYMNKADSSETSPQPVNIKKEAEEVTSTPTQESVPPLQREHQEAIRKGTEKRRV